MSVGRGRKGGERETETEIEREKEKEIDRQTDRQTERQTERQRGRGRERVGRAGRLSTAHDRRRRGTALRPAGREVPPPFLQGACRPQRSRVRCRQCAALRCGFLRTSCRAMTTFTPRTTTTCRRRRPADAAAAATFSVSHRRRAALWRSDIAWRRKYTAA